MITKADIQLIRSLADKRSRDEHGLFIAEGEKLIEEIRSSRLRIRRIFALDGVMQGGDIERVTTKDMERMSHLKTASSCLAVVEIPHHDLKPESLVGRLTLVLDDIQNPGNMGTIIRLADWFGISDVVCSPQSADCYNPKVVQATMGAILRVRVHYTDLAPFLREMQQAGEPIYGTLLDGKNIYTTDLTPHGLLVMGNEGRGIRPTTEPFIDHRLFIPPYPADRHGSESLNVAVATAVACAEFRRREL